MSATAALVFFMEVSQQQKQAAIDAEFPPVTPAADRARIQGLGNLDAPSAALGVTPEPVQTQDPPAQTQPNQPAQTDQLTLEQLWEQHPELKTQHEKVVEAERSRAITGYKQKRDAEDLLRANQRGQAEAQAKLLDLAKRARAGDEEAKAVLLESQIAQVLHEDTAAEVNQKWFQELQYANTLVAGDDPVLQARLQINRFNTVNDWAQEIAKVQLEKEMAQKNAEIEDLKKKHAEEIDKLTEAKATDMLAGKRQSLAQVTDLGNPSAQVSSSDWRVGTWKTLAEASTAWNNGEIPEEEYHEARRLYDLGRLPMGKLGFE